MATPIPLLNDAGTSALDRLEQQHVATHSRLHRRPRSITSGRVEPPSRPSQDVDMNQAVESERAVYEQTAAFVLQDIEIRAAGQAAYFLPETLDSQRRADRAIERGPAFPTTTLGPRRN
eukprot:9491592-Pyramimonas_sp.AAC.2